MNYTVLMHRPDQGADRPDADAGSATDADGHDAFLAAVDGSDAALLDHLLLEPPADGDTAPATDSLHRLYVVAADDLDTVLECCRSLRGDVEVRPNVDHGEGSDPVPPRGAPDGVRAVALLVGDEQVWADADEAEVAAVMEGHQRFAEMVTEHGGVISGGAELVPSSSATTLRRAGDDRHVTDGPYAEVVEQLGGYYVLDAPDTATLRRWVATLPGDEPVVLRHVAAWR